MQLFKISSIRPVFRRKVEPLDVFAENAPPHFLVPVTGTAYYYSELRVLVPIRDLVWIESPTQFCDYRQYRITRWILLVDASLKDFK